MALGACGSSTHKATVRAPSPTSTGPLVAPKTTPAQDGQYLSDLAAADPSLSTYVNEDGNVALQALLTDGAGFCAFLVRGGGIDYAMQSLAAGAQSVEPQTHLPQSMTTFNAIDAVALLTLCPSEQKLIPADDRARIGQLGKAISGQTTQAG
jgi:hypothetical protein